MQSAILQIFAILAQNCRFTLKKGELALGKVPFRLENDRFALKNGRFALKNGPKRSEIASTQGNGGGVLAIPSQSH